MLIPIIRSMTAEGLRISPEVKHEGVTLKLQGSCDSQALPALEQFLQELHVELTRTTAKRVNVDCEGLYFMNSASLKCFVVWLTKIRALPKSGHYAVHFATNPRLAWQRRSFGTIQRSVPDLVTLAEGRPE